MDLDYNYTSKLQPHPERRREILGKYPQISQYFRPYPLSAFYIFLMVSAQFVIGLLLHYYNVNFMGILLCSYFIGAFINHALYVMIHESCHNLIFGTPWMDRLIGIFCDFALVVPSAMGFRRYHLIHHTHLGEFDFDADLVSKGEGKLVGNIWWRKFLWMTFFMISQGILRPMRLKKIKMWNKWIVLNLGVIITFDLALLFYFPWVFGYLALSTFFALGPHALGGRWIQEHYTQTDKQETYSYYGPLNKLTFNMRFHNEHHDFFMAPWINLPKIKKMADEYYRPLISYNCWSKVLINFIFNPKYSPFSRIVHNKSPNESLEF